MTLQKKNLLANTDFPFSERFRDKTNPLWLFGDIVIQRIVAHGECSSEGYWRTSTTDYWILLFAGSAVLDMDGEELSLDPGDCIAIKAGLKHRVISTDQDETTVILIVRAVK